MTCKHFARTNIKLPKGHRIEDECKICPLRDKNGDCIKDIYDDFSEKTEERISEIWRIYYECNHK